MKRTKHLQSGGSFADAPSLIGSVGERQRDHNQVTDFVRETVKAGWVAGINQVTLREAMMRIDQRATMGHYNLGSLVQRKTKWRKELTDVAGTLPVIEADAAEALIVHLLALTHPDAQFSATPLSDNRVFAGWKTSYHRDQEQRFYVTGLSDVVDSVSDIVQTHRSGDGGRFYVRNNAVECPECHRVIAWVDSPSDQRQSPPVHLSRKERKV